MKKLISILLCAMMALSLAACRQPKDAAVDPTAAPKPTEAVTEQPTEEPTEAPTEAPTPTPAPTETPAPAVLSFDDCAEVILRLVPYKAYDGPLPADAEENEVLYFINDGSEICNYGPLTFAVEGETIVVCDTGYVPTRGIFVYGAEGRLISRFEAPLEGYRLAALVNGVLYTPDAAVDINTGEVLASYVFDEDCVEVAMQISDTTPRLLLSHTFTESGVYTISYDYNVISADGVWEETEHILNMIEDRNGEWTKLIFADGSELTLDNVGYAVIGADAEGNVYLDHIHNGHTVIKISPKGVQLKQLALPFDKADLWEPGFLMSLAEDGTIYAAVSFNDSFVIYRIIIK